MADWYFLPPGAASPQGPGTTEQLTESLLAGKIPPTSQVCRVGEDAWTSIAAAPEFREATRAAAPPPAVPAGIPHRQALHAAPAPVMVSVAYPAQRASPKTRVVYVLLALFLGALGIHNFYAGHFVRGAIQLGITLVLGFLIVPIFIVAVWALVECFVVTSDSEGNALA